MAEERLGPWQLVKKLGSGAMADSFLAKAESSQPPVVLKRFFPALCSQPGFVERFLKEAALAKRLNHPALAKALDFGQADGSCFLIVEYVEGSDLRSLFARRLPLRLGARLIADACAGVASIHELTDEGNAPLRLVHRALTSTNLMLAADGTVKVLDFGVARVEGKAAGATIRGKPGGMAPEQLLGTSDLRSDVYSLGAVLYELAAGRPPFDQRSDTELIRTILTSEPVPLLVRMPDVPIEFAMLVDKAMSRDPAARFENTRALATALEEFLAGSGEPVAPATLTLFLTQRDVAAPPTVQPVLPRPSAPPPLPSVSPLAFLGLAPAPAPAAPPPDSVPAALASPSGLFALPLAPPRPVASVAPASPAEARAQLLLVDARAMRFFEASTAPLDSTDAQAMRAAIERDESVALLVRFTKQAGRLLQLHSDLRPMVGERLSGVLEGLLLAEAYGALAALLSALEAAQSQGAHQRWVYETLRGALATADQAQRLGARLRETSPADPEGLERLLPFFGPELTATWVGIEETMELPRSREAVLNGLAVLVAKNPNAVLERVNIKRPKRLAELSYLLERGRVSDRQRLFADLLARVDPPRCREVMTGMARAATPEGLALLVKTLDDADEANRLHALSLLGKHFPDQVFSVLEPRVQSATHDARSAAERIAAWRAIGLSNQPEAYYAIRDTLKQKASLLNRGKVEAHKLDALEGLGVMSSATSLEFLRAFAEDSSQPETVIASARRFLLARELKQPDSTVGETRRWERTPSTFRDVVLDLGALASAARLLPVTDPALDIAFARLGKRLEVLLRVQQRATVRLVNGQWDVNTTPLTPPDAELGRVAEAVSKRGVGGFSLLGPSIPKDELQQLVRWLASGASGESTPHIERLEGPTPAPWVDTAPASPALSDTSREVMVRYADLVLELREWLETRKTSPQEPLPDVQPTLVALAKAMQTRATRFYGMIPAPDEAALHHQTNMTLLALGFGAELGLSLPRLEVLAMASFFTDVGHLGQVATRLPFAQQADSPNAISWVCVALDQLDGVTRTDAGLLSSIVGLARAWETLTSGAPMRQPMTSAQALDELHERFRPELTPLFARFALRHGVRPIGRRWP